MINYSQILFLFKGIQLSKYNECEIVFYSLIKANFNVCLTSLLGFFFSHHIKIPAEVMATFQMFKLRLRLVSSNIIPLHRKCLCGC